MSLADLISGAPIADDSDDGDAPMGSVSGRGASDDEESNKGVDLMGDGTGDEDSSEEGEDDSEEEREVRKGFIVDEEESSARKKKKKRRKQRGSDDGESSRKRRKDSDDDAGDLDEDDLALLEENTGVKLTGRSKGHKLKRLRRRRSASNASDASGPIGNLNNIFDDDDERGGNEDRYGGQELFDADEMAGFIEDDTQSESSGRHGSGSEDDDDRAARKALKKKQRQKDKTKGRGRRAGFGAGFVEGITAEAWQEVTDVFGNGADYAYALEDDAENQGEKELKDIFEPSEIASRMLTAEDDRIRTLDIPERMQLTSVGLAAPINSVDDIDDATRPFIPEDELTDAANWMANRISATATEHFALQDVNGNLPELHEQFLKAVADVIRFINIEFLEVPFIWAHRGDFLVHRAAAESGQQDTAFLDQDDCWRIAHLSIKYRALAQRKAELRKTFNSLEAEDEYFEDVFDRVKSVEDVSDLSEWVGMKYSRKLAEIKEEKMREEAQGEDGDQPKRQKRATRESAYDNAKRNVVSKLAEAIGLSATELSKAYFSTIKGETIDDPPTEPLVLAEGYCGGGSEYPGPEAALRAAKMIAVHEISRDPQLKGEARRFFRDYAVVSVTPTEKGQSKIDEMHSFYAFKYLRNKPLGLFLRSPQFLQILTAEKEDLVEARIELPEAAIDKFYEDLHQYYTTDLSSSVAEAWNEVRREILHTAVHSHLVPSAQTWARNYLQEEEEEFVGNICRMKLGQRINVAPYRRQDGTMEKGDIPSVLALSHGRGDPQRDDVTYCFIDSDGHFRENGTISNLFAPSETEREQFVDLLKRRRPQVVVIGGFSPATKRLMADFRSFAQGVTDSIVTEEEADPPTEEEENLSPDDRHRRAVFDATYVYDDVAKIYMNSQRAQLEFPDLTKIGKYCIGLARYAQSPINEYAALGPDLTALAYDPNQKFLPTQKLVPHLEKALIEVVNRLGVDINKAIRNAYYYNLLPYVAGLGPRKADGLVKKINSVVSGTLTTRHGLVTHDIMTKNVFMNAAGFLRIPQDDLRADFGRRSDDEEQPEVLDDTRIHPEEYEITRKMAADAMEIDEEETSRYKTASQAVIDLMDVDATKLDDLSLDDFAVELQKLLHVPKRLALYAIRDELQSPYAEPRPVFHPPSAVEVFTMLSGETQATLDRGLIIPVRYLKMTPDGVVRVRLDSGLEGSVQVGYRADEDGEGRYRPPPQGSTLQALVVELRHETFEVELSTQESAISHGDRDRRRTIPDYAYWDQNLADAEKEAQAAVEQKATGRQKRVLKHPSFQNVDSGKAEEFLSHMQRGDCVIRPSSKEDHLAVTWKVGEGIYQHVAVHELNKANPWSLGSTLRIAGAGTKEYTYSDLDELLVSHIKQMALKVNEMTAHEKFKGSKTDLDTWINNASMANPERSFYGFAFDPDRRKAGQFVLGFRANRDTPSEHWPIKVVPGAFVLMNQEHGSVLALCNAFKHAYTARTSSNPARLPGKTPMHLGGRTPMPGGGRTPMPGVPGSAMGAGAARTPNPYRMGGATPNPQRGGATPNPRGGATPNPYRPQGGATPMYPGGGADPRGQPPISQYGQGGPGQYGAPNQQQQQQQWQPHQNQPWGQQQQQNQGGQGGNYGQQQWGNGR